MTTQQFEWGVGLLMLAMGLSLTTEDFRKVSGTQRMAREQMAPTGQRENVSQLLCPGAVLLGRRPASPLPPLCTWLQCAANPVPILLGFVCQYSILPILAVVISRLMNLPAAFATGLILLGCCPGEPSCPAPRHAAGSQRRQPLPVPPAHPC